MKASNEKVNEAVHQEEKAASKKGKGSTKKRHSFLNGSNEKQEEKVRFTSIDAFKIDDMVQQFSVLESNHEKKRMQGMNHPDERSSLLSESTSGYGLRRFSTLFKKRIFKMNFVLFHKSPFGPLIYQLFLLIEFFQLFFLVYYSVQCRNGYINPRLSKLPADLYLEKLLDDLDASKHNKTSEAEKLAKMLNDKQILTIEDNIVKMENYAKFAIPNLYYLNSDDQERHFTTYWAVIAIFYSILTFYFALGPFLFKIVKRSQLGASSDGMKVLTFILASIVFILVTIAQVPMFTLLLQGFLCEENPLQAYTLPLVSCSERQPYVLVSILTLLLYLSFCCLVLQLKHSERLGSPHPWAAYNGALPFVKLAIKVILSASMILDKQAQYKSEAAIAALTLLLYQLARRFRDSLYFDRNVQYTDTSLDIILAYHLFFVNIHILVKERQSVSTIFIFLLNSLVFVGVFSVLQEYRLKGIKKQEADLMVKEGDQSFALYLLQMFATAKRLSDEDKMVLFDKLYMHADSCKKEKACTCGELLDKLESMKKYRKFKEQINLSSDGMKKQTSKDTPTIASININQEIKVISTFHDQAMTSGVFLNPLLQGSQLIQRVLGSGLDMVEDPYEMRDEDVSAGPSTIREHFRQNEDHMSTNLLYEELFGHPIDAEFVEENQWYLDTDRQHQQDGKIRKVFYAFIIQLIETVAIKEPRKVSLRLQITSILKNQLSKMFKSYYELQKCRTMKDPTINEQYQQFEHLTLIEQQLIGLHSKQAKQNSMLDVENLIEYNKSFLKFQKNEILAARATLHFWRQLLQKDFDAHILQQHGFEITRCFARVQDAASEINRISPGDIKFHFRLGMFLIKIINNEHDGIEALRTANIKYALRFNSREDQSSLGLGEGKRIVFTESQGFALVVMSTNLAQFGKIVHANCEIESIFGFQRNEILGLHVSCLMPHLIGKYHDHFVRRYLQSGKIKFADITRQTYAQTKERYIFPVDLMIKVYPKISGGIKLVSLIKQTGANNTAECSEHYIMTDRLSYVQNISPGLVTQLGLHPAFFSSDHSSYQSMVKLDKLAPNAMFEGTEEFTDQLANPIGFTMTFDTTNLLQKIETEALSHDEIEQFRMNFKRVDLFAKLIRVPLADDDYFYIYILQSTHSLCTFELNGGSGELSNWKVIKRSMTPDSNPLTT